MKAFFVRDYPKPEATTARGWVFLRHGYRPDREDNLNWRVFQENYPEGAAVGNYLDYEHDAEYKDLGPTVHAVSYLFVPGPTGTHTVHIGACWCRTPADAVAWIAETVRNYCWRCFGSDLSQPLNRPNQAPARA